jgi:hypothetical protein
MKVAQSLLLSKNRLTASNFFLLYLYIIDNIGMEHYDISNNQSQLFSVVQRSYRMDGVDGLPKEKGVRIDNYLNLIDFRSDSRYPFQRNEQLDNASYIGCFGKENSQKSKLPEPTINCTPRLNPEASRFNYAYCYTVDNKLVDVSGVEIPNQHLRVIPNRGTQLAYQNNNFVPKNGKLEKMVKDIMNISVQEPKDRDTLKYKASRQRLTKEELLGVAKPTPPPTPVRVIP